MSLRFESNYLTSISLDYIIKQNDEDENSYPPKCIANDVFRGKSRIRKFKRNSDIIIPENLKSFLEIN